MTTGVPGIGIEGIEGYKVPRKETPRAVELRFVPLSMIFIVQIVGTVFILGEIDYKYPYGMFLAGSFVSAMCFFGFLGLRAFPAGRVSLQVVGISTTLVALLLAAVIFVTNHGSYLARFLPYVCFWFVLPAIVFGTYLYRILSDFKALPPPSTQEGSGDAASVSVPIHIIDAEGIVMTSLLTALVPIAISLLGFLIITSVGGFPVVCPALLLIAALYMGIAAMRKGKGLYWTVIATLVVILYGSITLTVGLDGEEGIMLLGILILTYGLIAAMTFLVDALVSHRKFMYG